MPQPFAGQAFGEVGAMRGHEDPVSDLDVPQPDGLVDVVQSAGHDHPPLPESEVPPMVEEEAGRRSTDESEVRNVIARVAQLADSDSDDFTAYLSLWADDAVTVHPTDTARGQAEILARSRDLRARGVQGPGTDTMHLSTTQWVRIEGDRAVVRSYWLFYGNVSAKPESLAMGTYDDILVRRPDGWKLWRRHVTHGAPDPRGPERP